MAGQMKWGWQQQWKAQRGRCWICLGKMRLETGVHPEAMSIEHIVPKSRGGGENWRNKLLAHRSCNSERGAPFVWVKLSVFRRAAMARLNGMLPQTTVEGVDLLSSYTGAGRRSALTRRPVTVPSEMTGKALRVSLAELSKHESSQRRT